MERLNRQIGYDKKKDRAAPTEADKKDSKPARPAPVSPEKIQSVKDKLKPPTGVIEWLVSHPLIKARGLCELAGIDPANFHRMVNVKKEIPKEVQEKIIPILKNYGYNG